MLRENKIDMKWFALSLLGVVLVATVLWNLSISPLITQVTIIVLISIISLSWAFLGTPSSSNPQSKHNDISYRFESRNSDRSVGLKLQGLGQLNLAFEKFKQCPHNHDTANLIYNLASDFQIKGEPENAKKAFLYIANFAAKLQRHSGANCIL